MFGTLFNQKKATDENAQAPTASDSAQPVNAEPHVLSSTPHPAVAPTPQADVPNAQAQSVTPPPTEQPASPASPQGEPIGTPAAQVNQPAESNEVRDSGDAVAKIDASALSHLDPRAAQVLTQAQEEAKRLKQQFIEPDQILLSLLHDEQIYKFIQEFKVDSGALSKEVQMHEKMGTFDGQPILSPVSQKVFDQAYRDAKMRGANFVSPEDIFVVLCSSEFSTGSYLQEKGLKKEELIEKLSKNPSLNYAKKTVLEKFGIDLTEEARAGKLDPVAGRDAEIDRIEHILLRRTKNNPIIIGETGVGKTAIVEGLAQKIVASQVPKDLEGKRIFQLDVAALVAGASHRGEFEERLRGVINEVLASNNQIILFIDEIHSLMGTGEGGGASAANIIKPHLARGHFQLIGATTTIEFRKNFEKDKAFERRFQPVTADEPSEENAFEMMKVLRPKYEKFHKVTISDETLKECVKLSKKYIGERYLPDKAVDLLDEGASDVKLMANEGKRQDTQVKKSDIEKVVSGWTGIPITKLTEDESAKLLQLEDRIHKRLVGQEEAVVAVSEAVRRGRIGLAAANRPIASFVFLGPTGVGKTELAKTIAELLFGREDSMVRLDMSEYMEKHEVAKLIGAPPGYVGYEEGGQLTEAVRKKPYSIVLLDEIEKAHPDVFNILLQLLEDGRLTDNKGNTISFKNTIIICTSNIGSALIQKELSHIDPKVTASPEEYKKTFDNLTSVVKDELIKFFRPELLNRFDEVVIFKPLRQEHMAGIARLGIAKTAGLLKEQGFILQITEKAIARLAKDGYDPVYGARPLRRLIQTAIENPIALAIIAKKFASGDTIVVDFKDDMNEFSFTKSGEGPKPTEIKKILLQIIDPQALPVSSKKEKFTRFHDELMQKSKVGDALSAEILALNAASGDEVVTKIMTDLKKAADGEDGLAQDILGAVNTEITETAAKAHDEEPVTKFKKLLKQVINPLYLADADNKEKFSKLYDTISAAGQQNNSLATSILAVTDTTPDSDIQELKNQLEAAKAQGDPLATEILTILTATETSPVAAESNSSAVQPESAASQSNSEQIAKPTEDVTQQTAPNPVTTSVNVPNQEASPVQTDPNQAGPILQTPPPSPVTGAEINIPADPQSQNAQPIVSSVSSGSTFQPATTNPQFTIGSGMAALNEQLERDIDIISTQLESDGQKIS